MLGLLFQIFRVAKGQNTKFIGRIGLPHNAKGAVSFEVKPLYLAQVAEAIRTQLGKHSFFGENGAFQLAHVHC